MTQKLTEIEKEFEKLIEKYGSERQRLINLLERDPRNEKLEKELSDLCEKMGLPVRYIETIYENYEYDEIAWRVYFPKDMSKCLKADSYWLFDKNIEFYTHESKHEEGEWSHSYSC